MASTSSTGGKRIVLTSAALNAVLQQSAAASTSSNSTAPTNTVRKPATRPTLYYHKGCYTTLPETTNISLSDFGLQSATSVAEDTKLNVTQGDPMTKRQELQSVQMELKRNLHLHQMLKHKLLAYTTSRSAAMTTTREIEILNLEADLKECEEKISQLKDQQLKCVNAARVGLIAQNADRTQQAIINRLNRDAMSKSATSSASDTSVSKASPVTSTSNATTSVNSSSSKTRSSATTATNMYSKSYTSSRRNNRKSAQPLSSLPGLPTTTVTPIAILSAGDSDITVTELPPPTVIKSEDQSDDVIINVDDIPTTQSPGLSAVSGSVTSAAMSSAATTTTTSSTAGIELVRVKTEKEDYLEVDVMQLAQSVVSDDCPSPAQPNNRPHLLDKPVSVSPVSRPTNENEAQYSSVQESHMTDIKSAEANAGDEESERSVEFMAALDLVRPSTLSQINEKKNEKRRTRSRVPSTKYINSLMYGMNTTIYHPPSEEVTSTAAPAAATLAGSKRPRRASRYRRSPSPPAPPPVKRSKAKKPKSVESTSSVGVPAASHSAAASDDTGSHDDFCSICEKGGELLLCDTCPLVFHLQCVALKVVPEGIWSCPRCQFMTGGKSARKLATPKGGNNAALGAVQGYMQSKMAADAMKEDLLKVNADMVKATQSLTESLKNLNEELELKLRGNAELKEENQKTRNSFQKMIDMLKAVKACVQQYPPPSTITSSSSVTVSDS